MSSVGSSTLVGTLIGRGSAGASIVGVASLYDFFFTETVFLGARLRTCLGLASLGVSFISGTASGVATSGISTIGGSLSAGSFFFFGMDQRDLAVRLKRFSSLRRR